MVVEGETKARSAAVPSESKSRSSTKSRASRSSRSSSRRKRGWYCCPCPLTPSGSSKGGGAGVWPAPAKFYCCRADLVADMAKERTKQAENNNDSKGMQNNENDTDFDDDFAFDEIAEEALPDATFREVFDRSHLEDPDERWEIKEPDLPYLENLPHQLDVGRAIVVEGTVLPDAVGFAINLSCGPGEEPNIAFHLNPRLDRGYVARNSRTRGSWGQEEGAALGGSPFKCGQLFLLHILVTATGFKVSVDRMHFCNFQFRMPLSKVCRLEVHGDIAISSILHTRLEVYPERCLEALPEHSFCTIPADYEVPWNTDISEKENLFIGRFKPNLSSGMEITIKGRVKLLPQSFYVNLQQGSQLWPHPNVHFHLNPRFAAEDSEHVVVVNGWQHGSWGSEQKYNRCRFKPGEPFTMVIYVEEQRYRVMVDGLQQAAMFHRAPPSLVDTLVVRGDLFISNIGIAKSASPAERLPTPKSQPDSPCGSFLDIPTTIHSCSSSPQESRSMESEAVLHGLLPVPSKLTPVLHENVSTSVQNIVHSEKTVLSTTRKDESANSDERGSSLMVSTETKETERDSERDDRTGSVNESTSVASEISSPLPKAALSMIFMAVLYGGYILRK